MRKETADPVQPFFLGMAGVSSLTGLSWSTIKRAEKEGRFPASVAIGKRRKAWVRDEVIAWCDERVAQSRTSH
jgi:prophage regulatory protein